MKRLALLLTVVFVTLSSSAQKYYGMVSDPDGYTNIRRGPGTSYAISRRYSSGDYLYYTPVGNGWAKVYSGAKANTYMGYMATSRIIKVNPNGGNSYNNRARNYRSGYITDPTDSYVNVRKGPGTNYAIATRLYVGDFVYFTSGSGSWVKVYNSDYRYLGYVYRNRIR